MTTTTYFVDIGWTKLAVFWLNGAQREDLNKTVVAIGLCKGEYLNKPMGILCL